MKAQTVYNLLGEKWFRFDLLWSICITVAAVEQMDRLPSLLKCVAAGGVTRIIVKIAVESWNQTTGNIVPAWEVFDTGRI